MKVSEASTEEEKDQLTKSKKSKAQDENGNEPVEADNIGECAKAEKKDKNIKQIVIPADDGAEEEKLVGETKEKVIE